MSQLLIRSYCHVSSQSGKVAISEFGLLILMLILLNHYKFIEVMRYLHDNKWFRMHLNPLLCLQTKLTGPFKLHCVTMYCFYDVNLTISQLNWFITAEFTMGFSMRASLINILCL